MSRQDGGMRNDPVPRAKVSDPLALSLSLADIAARSQRVIVDFLTRSPELGSIGDPAGIGRAFLDLTVKMMADPMSIAMAQLDLWSDQARLWQHATGQLLGLVEGIDPPNRKDRRFQHPAWTEHFVFDYIKQSYEIFAGAILSAVHNVEGLDPKTEHKVRFYARQFVDALAPSNFIATNPEVLQATIESGGENLLKGLKNLVQDLERGRGQLTITMADPNAFRVGENLATTKGKVIFQNELMQLIQYAPSTAEVKRRPLLIIPPWINKFYILDLQPKNSFIKWAVDQGQRWGTHWRRLAKLASASPSFSAAKWTSTATRPTACASTFTHSARGPSLANWRNSTAGLRSATP
jgi:polyhydroxyalkanoate synthase